MQRDMFWLWYLRKSYRLEVENNSQFEYGDDKKAYLVILDAEETFTFLILFQDMDFMTMTMTVMIFT